jgi:adenosylhomocysteine nucleosidase
MSNKIGNKFNALCVEMEGASIAQVCHLCNIPFIVIRSISDSPNANDNNTITYEEFLTKSCKIVANYLKDIINNM